MTLRDLLADHPTKFYPQTWYEHERFLDQWAEPLPPLSVVERAGEVPMPGTTLPFAVQIVHQMLNDKGFAFARWYLWCRDLDALGQRVYVGQNGKGVEIHRHLHITHRWGVVR